MTKTEPQDAAARCQAVDATRSFLVEAPAGSGKTRLLVARYLELLKRVEHPEEILAITFTTKAASEMRARVLQALREDAAIGAVDQRRGWNLDSRPDRLKIQTIDSFALGLARRLPIASALCADNIAENGATLYDEAAWRVLERIADGGAEAGLVADFVALLDNDADHARAFVADALGKRDQWVAAVAAVAKSPEQVSSSVAAGVARLRQAVTAHLRAAVPPALRGNLETLGAFTAQQLDRPWPGLEAPDGWRHLADVLLRKDGAPRSRFDAAGGFPRHLGDEKRLAKTTAQALAQAGLAAALHQFRMLPAPGAPPGSGRALQAIAGALAFAIVDLNATFEVRRTIDFAEFTVAAGRALADGDAPTELALALDYRIRHILVDEFQDTSFGQHRMLVALTRGWAAGGGNTFFAVGDPMQSIYRFRNADLRLFLETAAQGLQDVPVERLRLTSNFRASAALVDWCNAVFQELFGKDTDPVRGAVAFTAANAENAAPGEVRTVICLGDDPEPGARHQGEVVAERVEELLRVGGRIAILGRTRAALRDILPVLRERGIAWRGEDVELLAGEPVVRDLQSLTVVLHDPADRLAWLALARSPMVGLDLVDLERVARALPEVGAAQAVWECGAALSTQGRVRWRRLATALRRGQRSLPPRARVEQAWLALGGPDAYQTDSAMPNAARFLSLLDADPALARHPVRLERALGQLFAADAAPAPEADAEVVEVMTIHKAKGLEFDHVIVPGMEQPSAERSRPLLLWRREGEDVLIAPRTHRGEGSLYDWLAAEENANDANEVKRLFYVAATRAARSLTLVGALPSGEAKPPEGSLLALVWPHVKEAAEFRLETAAAQSETTPRRVGRRLPEGHRFTPAVELSPVRPRARSHTAAEAGLQGTRSEARARPGNEEADGRRHRALGELVHRELRWLADGSHGAERFDVAERMRVWRAWLRALPVCADDASWIEAELRRQITGVLADPRGRWILFADPNGQSEAPFTSVLDGQPTRVVVDRTFVDDGARWVVDYKTMPIARGDEAALNALRERHAPQLARYARVLSAVDARPVYTALYFTALPRLAKVVCERSAL